MRIYVPTYGLEGSSLCMLFISRSVWSAGAVGRLLLLLLLCGCRENQSKLATRPAAETRVRGSRVNLMQNTPSRRTAAGDGISITPSPPKSNSCLYLHCHRYCSRARLLS